MSNQDWREAKRDMNRGGRFILLWVLGIVALVAIVGAIFWGINVATSGVKGQGDGIIKKNSAENWTKAQARFEEFYADIEATDRKITVAEEALALDPEDITAKQTLAGTVNYCLSIVGEYNAEANKFLSAEWRSEELPQEIDNSNPKTDCKGDTK